MAASLESIEVFAILAAGILPALFWLWFWLKEDYKRPEPRGLIVLSFFVGSFAVLVALPLQEITSGLLGIGFPLLFIWAGIEEGLKFAGAYFTDFRRRTYDEPIDTMIYLITVALGFAAYENVLFILKSVRESGLDIAMITAVMRFLGASLLHVLASAVLGGILALAYCKSPWKKRLYALWGFLVATLLHALFNYFIIGGSLGSTGESLMVVFSFLWLGIVALILFFERIKQVTCET